MQLLSRQRQFAPQALLLVLALLAVLVLALRAVGLVPGVLALVPTAGRAAEIDLPPGAVRQPDLAPRVDFAEEQTSGKAHGMRHDAECGRAVTATPALAPAQFLEHGERLVLFDAGGHFPRIAENKENEKNKRHLRERVPATRYT